MNGTMLGAKWRYEVPSKTKKQAKLMAAAAHNKEFADKVGVPQKVARKFNRADAKKGAKK